MVIKGSYDITDWFGKVTVDGQRLDPTPSLKIINHSPDGFAWGYGGSGPAQLALAILLHVNVPKNKALALYQRFKAQFIATLPRDSFTLEVDVPAWVEEQWPLVASPTNFGEEWN